jgi:hypothetical protein
MKQVYRLLSLLVLPAALVVLTGVACDQGSAPPRAWERGAFQEMPENSKSYSLPAGIAIDSMYGEADSTILNSDEPLRLQVSNSNSGSTEVTFPAGLVFSPSNADYQYMMLLKDFSFTAQAGVTAGILVPTYGCNEDSLDAPDDESFYNIGWLENDKETKDLFDLVANKTINSDEAIELLHTALDEITGPDFPDGLTDSTKTKLQALP